MGISEAQWNHCRERCGAMTLKEGTWYQWLRIHRLQDTEPPSQCPCRSSFKWREETPKESPSLGYGNQRRLLLPVCRAGD